MAEFDGDADATAAPEAASRKNPVTKNPIPYIICHSITSGWKACLWKWRASSVCLAALLVLAFVANRLSKLTRVPDLIVLLLIGIMLGPILHWVPPAPSRALSMFSECWH